MHAIVELTVFRWIAVWQSTGQKKAGASVYGRIFEDANAVTDEFEVSTESTGVQGFPFAILPFEVHVVVMYADKTNQPFLVLSKHTAVSGAFIASAAVSMDGELEDFAAVVVSPVHCFIGWSSRDSNVLYFRGSIFDKNTCTLGSSTPD